LDTGSAEHLSGKRALVTAGVQHNVSIDQDIFDTYRELNRIDKRSLVDDRVGIENDNIRKVARL
jgi:hypothetical protein